MSRVCTLHELIEVLTCIDDKFGNINIYDRAGNANTIVDFLKSGVMADATCLFIGPKKQTDQEVERPHTMRMLDATSGRSLSGSRA